MNIHRTPIVAGAGLLVLALPLSLAAASPPDELHLTGIVRDFHASHSDMEVLPEGGAGLYTGNVHIQLGADRKPVFTGQGARVINQYANNSGTPIPPHMYNRSFECQTGYPDQECVDLTHQTGGNNPHSTYRVCFLDVQFNADGTSTWRYSVEEIVGTQLSHWTLWLDPSVQVLPGTTAGWQWMQDDHPHFPGPGIKWDMGGGVTPGIFEIVLNGHYYGTNASWVQAKGGGGHNFAQAPFFGPSTEMSQSSSPYKTTWMLVHDASLGDQQGLMGTADTGGVTSKETFNQWFRDVPGVNMSRPITISLQRQADGTYVFDDATDDYYSSIGGFFPIDGALLGNTANYGHNYHYTYELHAHFTYDSQAGQFFEITSTDDVWVFIDGKLAIDLGGVHGSMTQEVDLDRMCLDCGEKYRISIFIGDRHTGTHPRFRVRTNTEPESVSVPAITAMFD